MAPQSSTLAWKIPWTEEPGRLQSMGSLRVGHDWATSLSLFAFVHWRRRWQPTPVFLPGESQGRGSLVGCHLRGHTVGLDWSDLAAAAEAAGWAPASSNQETPVPQGHRPQRGTTALGPRGPPLHCPPASNPCLVPRTRKALLAVLGSSLLFFFFLTSLQLLNYVSYPQGTSAARGGEGRSPVLLSHQHSSPGLLCSGSRLAEEQPSCFHSGIAPYRRAKACGPGCFIVTAQPLGTEPHWPFSHAFTSAEGEASNPWELFIVKILEKGASIPQGRGAHRQGPQ